ncbi:MAG TPA: sugar phosphate isomerase/epimerase family protein [Vicinamibacterales bacterium]|nr:sugar phosphate isomerase/epimerase family protein [Vicinamibacterales bacterium]
MINRRTFNQMLAMSLAAPAVPAWAQGKKRSVVIGHTGITWPGRVGGGRRGGGAPPPPPDPALNETIFKDVSELGFSGLELFDWQINGLESQGLLSGLVEKYKLPLVSSYTSVNLTDPAQRTDTIAAAVAVGKIMKKYGGKTIVVGPNGRVGGESYNYNDHKQNIVTTLNELGKAITDIGLIAALHQHTGTAVETRDETYATMEAVDTRYMKFGPDIGQLQKGGVDPVAVVKAFLPVVQHMHFKDWVGGPTMAGYCPLGLGKVNLVAILDLMEGRKIDGMIMVELDSGGQMPYAPRETAQIAHDWLVKNGVTMKA